MDNWLNFLIHFAIDNLLM
jgi:hypothetical protein